MDNAAGVAVLMAVMEQLKDAPLAFTVEFVPFNGEEHCGVPGQLSYLGVQGAGKQPPHLVINIDGLGHHDSRNAISLYNFDEAVCSGPPSLQAVNCTLSRLPTALAARSKVTSVTERLAGSRSLSTEERLVFILRASSDCEMLAFSISWAIW
ncbi:MAG: M28 family peptidase [Spirochaetaceae bacterium]|nr:MAG: M28 family peptidase [Spirochaetaceae bacterium]